ncbi:MAG: fumarylacetoacetate hydrolase family protein [Maribacter sp.]
MKILAIAANFYSPSDERSSPANELVVFTKPESSITKGDEWEYPSCSSEVWHELELVLKMNTTLKNASLEAAENAFDEIALGMDWTAKDLQRTAKKKASPWAFAKGFDGATLLSDFYPATTFGNPNTLDIILEINGEIAEKGNTRDLKVNLAGIIQYCSTFMTLYPGDLIMTGAPPSPGPIYTGDTCRGFIGEQLLLDFEVV